jgi:phospholipid/cholesterol/gamma-HCH transport system substrate-binding protein
MNAEQRSYRRRHRITAIKLGIFTVLTTLVFLGLAVVFAQLDFTSTDNYHAVFADGSGMTSGSKVRIAGVPVGTVTDVTVDDDNRAHIDFTVESTHRLLVSTRAVIRYENLVGDRYLELTEGPGAADRLEPGSTIPIDRTSPALDLDQLLGGFKPLLEGLNPDQANQLTAALIQVFQGQGDTLTTLLSSTGEFTKTLADRDALIGSVIDHLNSVLRTITDQGDGFDATVDQLQRLISGLGQDRGPIGAALPRLASAAGGLAQLLQVSRPDLSASITQLDRTAAQLNAGQDQTQWVLDHLPTAYRELARVGSYGSFMNMYVCATQFLVTGPGGQTELVRIPGSDQQTGRCAKTK